MYKFTKILRGCVVTSLNAVGYSNALLAGCCKPHILQCDDRNFYVVKFKNNPQGIKTLVNEYICYKLANYIGLPVAKAELIYIPQELIEIEERLNTVKPGLHFGSFYYKEAVNYIGKRTLKNITNISDIPGIIAFDYWIGNEDRTDNVGNLLIVNLKNACLKLMMIDHTHSFVDGSSWKSELLDEMHSVAVIPLDGKVYIELVQYIKNDSFFEEWFNKIEMFNNDVIKDIIYTVPEEWGLIDYEKEALFRFLKARKTDVRPAVLTGLSSLIGRR